MRARLSDSAAITRATGEEAAEAIVAAATLIAVVFRNGGKLLLCGNGGSAADCQHLATEFVSCLSKEFQRPGLPAVALTTDTSLLTAYANDCGFDGVFARQIEALGRATDALIAISTSGRSRNVLQAVEAARMVGLRTIALTGDSGPLAEMVDIAIRVPSASTNHIQESHLAIEHVLCAMVEREMFGGMSGAVVPGLDAHNRTGT